MRSLLPRLRSLVLPFGATGATPRLILGRDIPASLVTATAARWNFLAVEISYYNATDFYFRGLAIYKPSGNAVYLTGSYSQTDGVYYYDSRTALGNQQQLVFAGDDTNPTRMINNVTNTEVHYSLTCDVLYDNVSQPRGIVTQRGGITPTVAFGTVETELDRFQMTFRKGRAYKFELSGGNAGSAPGQENRIRLRRGFASAASPGNDAGEFHSYTTGAVTRNLTGVRYIRRAYTVDVLATISLTGAASAGTGQIFATTASPWSLTVTDTGPYEVYGQAWEIL